MSVTKLVGAVLGSAALVAGHGYVTGAVVDGTYHGGFIVDTYNYQTPYPDNIGWFEDATDNGFVDGSSYSSSDIICHKDAKNGALSASVKAGGDVELQWTEWPESHHGPVITYLANCDGDCTTVDKTSLKFFKIDEAGLIDDSNVPGTWASDNLISNNNSYTVTIPSSIAAGNYVLRHEIIALHSAGETNGAQNYPQCINLKVTGGGSDSPAGTLGTALYKNTDAGIKVNIYQSLSSYEIPGPALYSGASSGSGSSAATTAAASAATTTAGATVAPVATSSATPVSASPSSTPLRSTPLPPSYSATIVTSASSQAQQTQPAGEQNPAGGAPAGASTVTETAAAQVTNQVSYQTATVDDSVTVTASPSGQSQQSATPSSGSSSSDSSSSDSSDSSSGSSSSGSSSSGSSTTTTGSSSSSSYNSSDWSSYLDSLSADQFVSMLRKTVKWLVTDKKHARSLTN
ncbi:hypothetical protein N7509_007064 [Penicillium cosmopolitanum]|uniref:Auxiliary Activity family 9 catalytic domain-containing protein n=1 Tax=Penicillium cosmopolitanum TaxID=1131564 RepID=A0A9W9VYB0_9EURO|nr:uncharacterized protein N7509_007064 [Penicillium cosmopolitanum]KAJ5391574.1 hypothetical protein N7509_007064 [Penicillium cosmopolitanum]